MSTLNTYNLKSPDSANTNLALDASGNVAIQAGSASAPSIYVTGDTNTGLYSPGADQIAVTTGGTARLFIDSSGRLLVGTTTSNGAQLEVNRPQSVATGLSALLSSPQFSITNSSNWGFPVGAVFKTPLANGGAIVDNAAIWAEWSDTNSAYLGFATRNSGTIAERARIDSSGRLLVGTSSARSNIYSGGGAVTPTLQLENNTNTWSNGLSILNYSGSQYGASLALGMSASNTPGTNALVSTGNLCGRFHFLANDGTNFYPIAEIGGWTDGTTGTGDVPGRLTFSTTADGASSPTERMRIDSGGMFYFRSGGVTPSSSTPGSSYGYAGGYYWVNAVATTGVEYHWAFVNPNGEVGKITTNSTSTSFATTSDYRLKENVIPVTDGVARLQQLKPSRFNFIAEPSIVVDGFLAHEVQAVVPEAIVGEKDEVDADGNPVYQGIDQSKLVPLLTAALQEAIGEIESLKARVAALESA